MKHHLVFVAGLLGAAIAVNAANAADPLAPLAPGATPVETPSGWTITVAPYFWAAGMKGDIAQFGLPQVHVDARFSDILDNLDFAAMAVGEARYDRYSVFGDIMYTKLSNSATTPNGVVADDIEVTSKTFAGLLGAGYSVIDGPNGRLDVVGAVRLWSTETTISFSGGLLGGVERNDSATWADALAGLKGNYFLTPNVYLTGWAMAGAGGADLDWDVMGGVGYKFNDRISAVAGYRALGVDYSNDGFVFDVVEQGPIIGVAIHF
jgi:hypothetical protein